MKAEYTDGEMLVPRPEVLREPCNGFGHRDGESSRINTSTT